VVLRVGDGVAALTTTGAVGHLLEMSTAGVVAQSIALPTVSGMVDGVVRGSCTFYGSATSDITFSAFGNGAGLAIGCYNAAPGAATNTAAGRTIAVVDHLGGVDTGTTFTAGVSEFFRGLASFSGDAFYVGGSVGIKYVARGAQRAAAAVVTTGTFNMRAMAVGADGALLAAVSTTPFGILQLPPPLPTAATNVSVLDHLLPGTASVSTYVTAFYFDVPGAALYTVSYYGLNGALLKYTQSAGAWILDPAYPKMTASFAYTHPTAGVVTPYGLKSVTGYRRPSDGRHVLYLVTYHSTSCTAVTTSAQYCSVLLSWDADSMPVGATFVAKSDTHLQAFVAVGWAPVAPSASASPSATPSGSATGSPSNSPTPSTTGSAGASASGTHTAEPTPPETPSASATSSNTASSSVTASATGSASVSASPYPVYGGAPFTPGNLAVLKVGDGVAALTTNGAAGYVLEVHPLTGAIVQTIALPTVAGVVNGSVRGGCVFSGSATSDVNYGAFTDGQGLAIGCYSSTVGGATTAAAWRTAAVVGLSGSVDTSTVFSIGASELVRGIASADGSSFYVGGSTGLKHVARGARYQPAALLSAGSVNLRGMSVGADGALYAAIATTPYGVARVPAPLPTAPTDTLLISRIMPGTSVLSLYATGFHFDDRGALYTVQYLSTVASGALAKFTLVNASWVMAPGFPKTSAALAYTAPGGATVAPYGLRSVTGTRTLGGYML